MIGKMIKHYRVKRGLKTKELAAMIFRTRACICNWESESFEPNQTAIRAICKALKITPNDLFEWKVD